MRADDVPRPVVVRTDRYPGGNRMGAHEHRKAQLVDSPDGVLRVATDAGTFVVPPEWAVWVPPWRSNDWRRASRWERSRSVSDTRV